VCFIVTLQPVFDHFSPLFGSFIIAPAQLSPPGVPLVQADDADVSLLVSVTSHQI